MPSNFIKSADDIDNLFKRPEFTVPCEKCGKLFRAESEQMVWSIRQPQYKNYCKDCYYKTVNENPSEEQLREWAEESINRTQRGPNWLMPWDCSYENFNKKVRPIIAEVLQERKKKQKRDYRQKKIDEAIEMLKEANSTCDEDGDSYDYQGYSIMHDIVFINAVATLLEKIEDLEEKASKRDICYDRFTI